MSTPITTPEKPAREPAATVSTAPRSPQIGATVLGGWTARLLMIVTGTGFVAGFFMPWVSLGSAAHVSGFGLLTTSGEMVDLITGPHQFLLFAVPIVGAGLIAAGMSGRRFGPWLSIGAGLLIVVGGFYTAIRTFLSATGIGTWIVVFSALIALAVGLLTIGRSCDP
jgi:hypothetical protein